MTCTTVAASGAVKSAPIDAHGHSTSANTVATHGGCTMSLAGLSSPVNVSTPCAWTSTIASYNTVNGSTTGTVFTNCPTTLQIVGWACTVTVPPATLPVVRQNVTTLGASSPVSGPPAGLLTTFNGSMPITSTCPGFVGPATYSGRLRLNGVWAVD